MKLIVRISIDVLLHNWFHSSSVPCVKIALRLSLSWYYCLTVCTIFPHKIKHLFLPQRVCAAFQYEYTEFLENEKIELTLQ